MAAIPRATMNSGMCRFASRDSVPESAATPPCLRSRSKTPLAGAHRPLGTLENHLFYTNRSDYVSY
jgi:hypothetical protein